MTYQEILDKAKKKPLTIKQHEDYFKPFTKEDDTILFDFPAEALIQAEVFAKLNNTKPYQHVWTLVEGDSGKECLINGWHVCNRLAYVVCEVPWGIGTESDTDVYIESKY